MITIALSKGRIFDETVPLLAAAGISTHEDPESSRKLILETNVHDVRVIIVRAADVPTYVQYGAADLGVAGRDVLDEHGGLGFNYLVNQEQCSAELYIDRGKGSEDANKAIFDRLLAQRQAIEAEFGGGLSWERLDTKRASRIRVLVGHNSEAKNA